MHAYRLHAVGVVLNMKDSYACTWARGVQQWILCLPTSYYPPRTLPRQMGLLVIVSIGVVEHAFFAGIFVWGGYTLLVG